MAKDENSAVETLKERGLSCARLKSMEKRERAEAGEFRKVGFINLADAQEKSANALKELRNKVCKLR